MRAIAESAADIVRGVYRDGNMNVEYKVGDDPVTRADKEANAFIVSRLQAAFPNVPIVAEESEAASYGGYVSAERAFFVDPLDGTRDFVARTGEFAVMIGLAEAGKAVAGVVVEPVTGNVYFGAVGEGARCVSSDGVARPIAVSTTTSLAEATVTVSRSHRSERVDVDLARLGAKALRHYGSAGLKSIRVAEGVFDAYVHTTTSGYRWDSCAPEAIVHAAGGVYTDARGRAMDYRSGNLENATGVLASNPILHREALHRLWPSEREPEPHA
ncbi:MAG: 3'(2'),5'-bisphosphate nucleotidase CysQ [Polyangiaceae bacterium]